MLGDALSVPPYQTPSRASILYLKPANTRIGHGHDAALPVDADGMWADACLGVVIGQTATRVPVRRTADFVVGYTIVNNLTVLYANYYQPTVRRKRYDDSCPMGPRMIDRDDVPDANALDIAMRINGEIKQRTSTLMLVRPTAQLLVDMTAFMTLEASDMLPAGIPEYPPLVRAGDYIDIDIAHIDTLTIALIRHA